MIAMDFHDGHFGTDATFWEAGENHIHVLGTPVGHRIQMELGELEVEVERHHAIIGDYRV